MLIYFLVYVFVSGVLLLVIPPEPRNAKEFFRTLMLGWVAFPAVFVYLLYKGIT